MIARFIYNQRKKRSAKRIFRELRKRRREAVGMNKKQKKVLVRIIIAAVLMIVFGFLPVSGYLRFGLYMIRIW